MTDTSQATGSAELWLLEQIQFCLQHNLNASLQTNPCVELVVAGEAQKYLAVDIPECVSQNVSQRSSFRHRHLNPDDELLHHCLQQGSPINELVWSLTERAEAG